VARPTFFLFPCARLCCWSAPLPPKAPAPTSPDSCPRAGGRQRGEGKVQRSCLFIFSGGGLLLPVPTSLGGRIFVVIFVSMNREGEKEPREHKVLVVLSKGVPGLPPFPADHAEPPPATSFIATPRTGCGCSSSAVRWVSFFCNVPLRCVRTGSSGFLSSFSLFWILRRFLLPVVACGTCFVLRARGGLRRGSSVRAEVPS
jgi:hypothetical protein